MSRDQRRELDAMLRKLPQASGPVPVERIREGFAAFMGSLPVPADVRRTPAEVAGRPAVLVEPEVLPGREPSCTSTAAGSRSGRRRPRWF